ncbi:MAG: hypothetical protein CMK83_06035 [Pseudomonadales bacterium]|uniref:hypothetical protein n=1 Tax=unclassified Ketobacter TaxID=2639109 RepID=UPI000C617FD7|nr:MULTISPECIES: hypothetical protein [unclassified Ketobacter]MAA59391.1 hypothetical protein [Pseudomonadales bacterium]MEC8810279.1 hypothetical protein [Pseudomonadota bacterium]HAG95506.1 hypothetical protein [Gammaproteobacteria bacterium]MAQ23759.1 hypothetical protein [Pseudomonadales bacterium]MBI26256.1 hypothetical protein [Pseudomonadales bacterium]
MSSLADFIKRPVAIQGREVVLLPDLVGPVPISEQHQYVESCGASNTCPAIHVRETDIEEMRERYPEYPVYGLWHVLINSGLVSFKRTLQVIPITQDDGYYIHCDLGRAEYSGIYEAGFFAADAGFTLDEAQVVNADLEQLVLPDQEAKLASELRFERQLVTRQAWSYLAISVVTVVAMAFGVNFLLAQVYDRAHRQLESKNAMLEDLQSGLDKLRTTRLTEVPNDQETLERLAILWREYPNIETEGSQSLEHPSMVLTYHSEQGFKSVPDYTWLKSRYDPKGLVTITMQNRGR